MSDESTETGQSAGQVDSENSGTSEAPEWVQKELDRARKEAAKYRDRARSSAEETENKLREEFSTRESDLKSQIEDLTGKYEDALVQASEHERSVNKLRLALENGIPSEHVDSFTKRLVGETYDELAEDAKSLASFFSRGQVQEDHSQGSGAEALNSPTLLQIFERKLNTKY